MRILSHDDSSADALQRPAHPLSDKIRRLVWNIACSLIFRPSPVIFHGWRSTVLRWFGAKIGSTNYIYPTARIWAPWLLSTEDVVTIGPGVEVYNPGGLYLAHHTIVSQGAFLCGATHDYNSADFTYISKPIRTEPYAWICARAVVLPGVILGEGSVLGAASVATRSLEAWVVYAGNPCCEVSKRNPEVATH